MAEMHIRVNVEYSVSEKPGSRRVFWERWDIGKNHAILPSNIATHLIVHLIEVAGKAGMSVAECNAELDALEVWLHGKRLEEAEDG